MASEPPLKKIKFTDVQVEPLRMQTRTIELLPREKLLQEVLLECRNESGSVPSDLEIRFTGGWVRDKLLGIDSCDIDVGLSSMTGIRFGIALQSHIAEVGAKYMKEAENLGVPPDLKGLHQIAANPEKSKHLETVTTRIFGQDVDLVNLRKETYTEDSRNPQMEFGTAEEDARRRDSTVNALFYNLDTKQVEDFTGMGLDDMAAGIIRTPLEPYQTFMDDPLRVLRLIRFASKLGYRIDDEARQSMKDDRIHAALNAKISRERVGVEVAKMIAGRYPLIAFQLIHDLNLYSTVFLEPGSDSGEHLKNHLPPSRSSTQWPHTWPHAYKLLAALLDHTSNLAKELTKTDDTNESLWILAAYAPFLPLRPESAVKNARGGLKLTNKLSKILEESLKHQHEIRSLIDRVAQHDPSSDPIPRSTVGFAIRTWGVTWRQQVLYSLLAEAVLIPSSEDFFQSELERYAKFIEFVLEQRLQEAAHMKPLLRGNEIQRLFDLKKSGPWMKTCLDELCKWQFDHEGADTSEAKAWILTQKDNFGIA
ncbi:putative trna nucleotidyltransferase [Phaeomoniella chlamydospora]|uniref:Putative trna nucleotidyltransferase n=1 Tax=Phaeomoniella chlamydospora TaxID=158046 RepID=A0A0G2ET43_PHACM|nr:putative trna nucleotidyltransferase [Phaeomoniella chlamydospora]